MKELSIEEKAKAYDEALKVLHKYDGAHIMFTQDLKEEMFPELKENEDERIRKSLINYVYYHGDAGDFTKEEFIAYLKKQGEPLDKIVEKARTEKQRVLFTETNGDANIDWDTRSLQDVKLLLEYGLDYIKKLEKQGEQKPTNKVEPKFKVGDWVVSKFDGKARQISEVHYDKYNNYYVVGSHEYDIEDYDRLHHLWTIQDAKDGDVLATKAGGIFIYKEFLYDKPFAYCGVDKFGVFKDCNCGDGLDWTPYLSDVTPATKEQHEALMKTMADAGYTFDFEKKELKKIEQNPIDKYKEWYDFIRLFVKQRTDDYNLIPSRDDIHKWGDNILNHARKVLEQNTNTWSEEDEKNFNEAISYIKDTALTNWLKSLKERVQPKQEWKQENTGDLTDFENAMMHIGDSFFGQHAGLDPNDTSVVKEQAKLLLELVPKQEWSEEDENNILFLTSIIEEYFKDKKKITLCGDTVCANFTKEDVIDRLKSLRPQPHWKPSDEQMKAMQKALVDLCGKDEHNIITGLYYDLKKLRGEWLWKS